VSETKLGHSAPAGTGGRSGRRATEARKAEWFLAMRWRRRVEAALADAGLTFTQWLVLEGARQLIAESGDAVNQNEIAARVELDRSTISQVMITLQEKSLVDRGVDSTGRALRIFLTPQATRLLRDYQLAIEAASSSAG
jgi:DNA-binding MarR family transcriptional regulator